MNLLFTQAMLIIIGGFCIAFGSFIVALILTLLHKLVVKSLGLDKNEEL